MFRRMGISEIRSKDSRENNSAVGGPPYDSLSCRVISSKVQDHNGTFMISKDLANNTYQGLLYSVEPHIIADSSVLGLVRFGVA